MRGRPFVARPAGPRFWDKVAVGRPEECWPWKAAFLRSGYGRFVLTVGATVRAHRFAWELTNGPIPDGLVVMHACDNPPCVNPGHLRIGTQADNMGDRAQKGRAPRGERHWRASLTVESVEKILSMLSDGAMGRDVASAFGISQSTVSQIRHGQRWKHLRRAA